MTHSDPHRAEHEHNVNAAFGWIAAATTLLVALFFIFSAPSERVASDAGKSATTGQSSTE